MKANGVLPPCLLGKILLGWELLLLGHVFFPFVKEGEKLR